VTGYALRFYRDVLAPDAGPTQLPNGIRAIYVRSGAAWMDGMAVAADGARFGDRRLAIAADRDGATVWRCELAPRDDPPVLAPDADSTLLLDAPLTTFPRDEGLMMRCDSVAFPPGGCAYTHTHKGPGIRCLQKGTIRIDSDGHSTHYGPEQPWFEAGPVPVFAQADRDAESRFIRVSILPRALEGKSSIAYVLPEDRDKPKTQTYRGYFDEFIEY
jgi:hypothetical protein